MISVLIPVYEYDVTSLVTELYNQLMKANCKFEILIFDDGSNSKTIDQNLKLNELPFVVFKSHDINSGLSTTRNLLIKAAKYDYLLLIDADMAVVSPNYISIYHQQINKSCEVVYGGIIYANDEPGIRYKLRWTYGHNNEALSVGKRAKRPYKSILSSNLLIERKLADSILYETSLKNYGYEDTVFAYKLKLKKSKITHINNPLIHMDRTSNKEFLDKTKIAIKNLNTILEGKIIDINFTPLGQAYKLIKRLNLENSIGKLYKRFESRLEKQLTSANPSPTIFNFYKLGYFCSLKNKS